MLLIFDLDGTLFMAKQVVLLAVSRLLEEMDVPAPDENDMLKNAGQGLDALLRSVLPGAFDFAALRQRYVELLCEAVHECGELFPGVYETLSRLANESYELTICSNSPLEYIEAVLQRTRTSTMIARYCSTEGYPSKAALIREMAEPGRPAVVIGDTHGDIEAAHENDLPAIAVAYGYGNKSMLSGAERSVVAPEGIIGALRTLEVNIL